MFIAMRLHFIISTKSEMLSILLFAEVSRLWIFYKHYVTTARFYPHSIER